MLSDAAEIFKAGTFQFVRHLAMIEILGILMSSPISVGFCFHPYLSFRSI